MLLVMINFMILKNRNRSSCLMLFVPLYREASGPTIKSLTSWLVIIWSSSVYNAPLSLVAFASLEARPDSLSNMLGYVLGSLGILIQSVSLSADKVTRVPQTMNVYAFDPSSRLESQAPDRRRKRMTLPNKTEKVINLYWALY